MSKKKKTLVPKLRFPEFRKSASWREKPLSSVLSEDKLKSDGKAEVHSVSLTKGVVSQIEHMGRSFSAADTSHYSLVRPFDVIYTKSPLAIFKLGIVKQHRGPHNALVSPLYGVFSPINRYAGQLIEAYFDSPARSLQYLDPLAQKGAKNTIQISNERFLSGEIFLPYEESEQKKIANCLSSFDELIAAEVAKLEAYKDHIKGLMQKLFPAEGKTVPQWRFPEFRDAGEWKEKSLGQIGENLDSKRVPITAKKRTKGEVPYYGASGIVDYVEGYIFDEELLCISEDGANLIARTYPIAFSISGKAWVNNHAHVLRFSKSFTRVLVENYLNSISLEDFLTGMAQPKLNRAKLDIIPIPLPDLPEQQKIADCLTSLNDLIAAQVQKIETLKAHKKGLMQGLFPSAEEEEI